MELNRSVRTVGSLVRQIKRQICAVRTLHPKRKPNLMRCVRVQIGARELGSRGGKIERIEAISYCDGGASDVDVYLSWVIESH